MYPRPVDYIIRDDPGVRPDDVALAGRIEAALQPVRRLLLPEIRQDGRPGFSRGFEDRRRLAPAGRDRAVRGGVELHDVQPGTTLQNHYKTSIPNGVKAEHSCCNAFKEPQFLWVMTPASQPFIATLAPCSAIRCGAARPTPRRFRRGRRIHVHDRRDRARFARGTSMRRFLPVWVLFFASFVIAEMLLGASTVSRLGAMIPVLFYYGSGAVLIRELARRRSVGWRRIVALGVAYGILEEGVVIQSLFNPDLFHAGSLGARVAGVNGVWTEWTLGYHAVFSILIPIFLVELMFPARRRETWLGWKGLATLALLYTLSALAIGIAFRRIVAPGFYAPPLHLTSACILAAALVALAVGRPAKGDDADRTATTGATPAPWLVGVLAFLACASWFLLLMLPESLKVGARVLLPIGSGLMVAAAASVAVDRWSRREAWSDRHRIAMVLGALPPVMVFGFVAVTAGNRVDQIGQAIISVVVYAALIAFAARLGRENETARRERVATGGLNGEEAKVPGRITGR